LVGFINVLDVPSPKFHIYVIGSFGCKTPLVLDVFVKLNWLSSKQAVALSTVNAAIGEVPIKVGKQISIVLLKFADLMFPTLCVNDLLIN
jgi:hypothetical protein